MRKRYVPIAVALAALLALAAYAGAQPLFPQTSPAPSPTPTATGQTPEKGPTPALPAPITYEVYFTPQQAEAVERRLVELIDSASESVYAAFFELELESVADALLRAHRRGVDVRVVTDTDHLESEAAARLAEAGILRDDRDRDFMHNKFLVVDGRVVWTGSMNPTANGLTRNNNNVIVIVGSYELAQDYLDEFKELWAGRFGGGAPVAGAEAVLGEGFTVEVYFAPEDAVEARILEELGEASGSIHFATFTFTSRPIAEALLRKHQQGVNVKGIYESRSAGSQYSTYKLLLESGVEVIRDKNPAAMHHKFFVIDNRTVITGSFNPTRHANEDNDENLLVIHNEEIARLYEEEFTRLWAAWRDPPGQPPTPPAVNVVISEVELNPPGADREKEWVELYNPNPAAVDLGGYALSTIAGRTVTVVLPEGATIAPYGFYVVTHSSLWLDNEGEVVILYDASGAEIDRTPALSDVADDGRSWQRPLNRGDTGEPGGWVFEESTGGKPNAV